MAELTAFEKVLRRDRAVVAAALAVVTALSWLYLVDMAIDMRGMSNPAPEMTATGASPDSSMEGSSTKAAEGSGDEASMLEADAPTGTMAMTQIPEWTPRYFLMMFTMWAVMMVGMMVPSAAPMILIYAQFSRKRQGSGMYLSTGAFVAGYLTVWTAFSLAATVAQWGLDSAALLSPMMVSTSPLLGAGLLIAAGIFQFTPWKSACLSHCRSPFQFFMEHWRAGRIGALRMGLHHGWYCLGCCWALMGLLFFGGVMNLVWIGLITAFVLLEKILPRGAMAGRVTGVAMIGVGVFVLVSGVA